MVESVAVMVSGGGATAGPGSSHRDSELIAPHSLSFSGPFHLCFLSLCMYITRITLCHVLFNPSSSSCSYSAALLHPSSLGPRLRLHLPSSGPRLRLLLSSPSSKCPSSLKPRLRLLETHAPFPPSPHSCILPLIEYSSLQFHFDIQQTIYHQT